MKKLAVVLLGALIFTGCTANTPTANSNVDTTTKYTLADIAKHASASDCWMAIEGNVYNVTSFIPNHPGGEQILQGCGKDATQLFEGQGHSGNAREILAGLQIGVLSN